MNPQNYQEIQVWSNNGLISKHPDSVFFNLFCSSALFSSYTYGTSPISCQGAFKELWACHSVACHPATGPTLSLLSTLFPMSKNWVIVD